MLDCQQVGDSIVHKARETLERAIQLVTRNSSKWENARVVYGDTDSMFIALEGNNKAGCSKSRAFEVGREICAAVTADNPTPVKLKFEKVSCIPHQVSFPVYVRLVSNCYYT